jgi:acyl-CoA thioesterase I
VRTLQKSLCLSAVLLLLASFHPTQRPFSTSGTASAANSVAGVSPTDVRHAGLPVIVAFGDSLTAGFGVEANQTYPACLQRDLDADGYHYRVVNLGISGNTTKDALARVKDVLELKPALTIVVIGGNDGLRGLPVPDMQKNLDTILGTLKRSGTKVVIGGVVMPPNYGANYVKAFNAVYPALAAKYQLTIMPFILQDVWNNPSLMQADGIHPTAPGYAIVARKLLPIIEPLLKKQH